MAITCIIHVVGAEAIVGEIEDIPNEQAGFLLCTNPRGRDGKPVKYIEAEATRILFPWHRISFVETMPSEEDQEDVESFFRE